METRLSFPKAKPGERSFWMRFRYTEDDSSVEYAFVCNAKNVRSAAETFWNLHPNDGFRLISVNDGTIEAFWNASTWQFETIPQD